MSLETKLKIPAKWKKTKTDEGMLYTYVSSDTRTCLIKNDMTVEIRANGFLSSYPSEEDISEMQDVKELLEKIQNARFCVGTKEGFNCENILYAVGGRINGLCVRCPHCRILRKKQKDAIKGQKRKEYRCLIGVSEEERNCVVKDCPGRDTARIRCYPIPQWDIEAWCANLKLNVSDVNETTRVCSRHFEESCKNPRTLKGGARPTLNLGHNDEIPFQNEKLILVSKVRVCCIVDCFVSHPPHQLFHFPEEEERLKQWLLICVIKDEMMAYKHKFICRKHFDASAFHNNTLKKDAIPKMDAVSWLENNAKRNVDALKTTVTPKIRVRRSSQLEPEVQALSEIQSALVTKMEIDGEDVDSDSDLFDSLQCRNVCLTCAKAFKDCDTYRQGCYELERQLLDLQAKTDELKTQNEILLSELEGNYVVYQEEDQ